jgi:diacylglycerol kinase (ATP)
MKPFSIADRLKSVGHAARGLVFLFRTQHNARIHLAATLLVIALGWGLRVSPDDWRWLTVAIVLVWAAEAMNTALEHLCNVVSPGLNPSVRMAKDIGAGAVLICSAGAAALGAMIFLPYLQR